MPDFGTDISCVSDLDATGLEVSGRLLLGQAIARRLYTPRGRLIDDANYGLDLRDFLNADLAPAELAQLKSAIEAECTKDERILGAQANVQFTTPTVMTVGIVLQDGAGPFSLVLNVTDVTVTALTTGL